MKRKLTNLQPGDKFIWNSIKYNVVNQEFPMTEVYGNGRNWAWPANVYVNQLRDEKI